MVKTKKQMFTIIGVFTLVMLLGTVTYAFFNYTRTGSANNIRTGRIYFNADGGNNTVTLSNLFPISLGENETVTSSTPGVGSLVLHITGDTEYTEGVEYLIEAVDVEGNGQTALPISIDISYAATEVASGEDANVIGTNDEDYFTNRGGNTSRYKLLSTGTISEGEDILVGYIAPGATGINGELTILAYLDADNIAITDTYPSGTKREVVANYSTSACETALAGDATAQGLCADADDLQDAIDNSDLTTAQINALLSAGIVTEYTDGTTSEWVNGRTVFTTEEWNALQTTGVSFKIKATAQEGTWVEEPAGAPTMSEMCPDCVFAYSTTSFWTTWNTNSQTPSVLTSSDYSTNYEDVITASGKNFFLGLKLNGSNQIEKAYACGLYNGTMPFCIEGYSDGTKYEANKTILQDAGFWNNTCSVETYDEGTEYEYEETYCAPPTAGMMSATAESDGDVIAGVVSGAGCVVDLNGNVVCYAE